MKSKSGQTLIEVMVALFVLTAGFLGILSLLSQSLHLSKIIGNQATATYLSAEGLELTKNILDHDIYQSIAGLGTGWAKAGRDTAFCSAVLCGAYRLDAATCVGVQDVATPCNPPLAGSGEFLKYNAATNSYGYGGPGATTGFTRTIKVIPTASPQELDVQSIVTWNVGMATQQSVVLEDYFYNWHP